MEQSTPELPFTRLVAVYEGTVVGSLTYEVQRSALYFGSLGVLTNHRRNGITREFISYLEQIADKMDLDSISCETILEIGNVGIFEALGFVSQTHTESLEFESPNGDVVHEVFMEKSLTSCALSFRSTRGF
jgi:predicted N-acetyltransferase YhbS